MNEQNPSPDAQAKYQVRFDWGRRGAARIGAGVDILVWVDVLPDAAGRTPNLGGGAVDLAGLAPIDAAVLEAGLVDASAAARWILAEQERLGRRAFIAVVGAGDADERFAADDLLGAGAVIDALAGLGVDDTSPEAAVAAAAFGGLRRAVRHLTSASTSGRSAAAAGLSAAELHTAAALDSSDTARVLRAGGTAGKASRG
ncbi:2-phosphosulfolactate phosphatase [Agromyces subbeticus]|uniref:2-phosphosulfolactate phosphatase n=1 Tax=Agromyces subbeticus TaxID=293890 RepID=UPI00047D8976|nr:2-phosphosulfolactate phosphatase [Agromyces subbeticus]